MVSQIPGLLTPNRSVHACSVDQEDWRLRFVYFDATRRQVYWHLLKYDLHDLTLLRRSKSSGKIGDYVFRVFESDRQPNQLLADPRLC